MADDLDTPQIASQRLDQTEIESVVDESAPSLPPHSHQESIDDVDNNVDHQVPAGILRQPLVESSGGEITTNKDDDNDDEEKHGLSPEKQQQLLGLLISGTNEVAVDGNDFKKKNSVAVNNNIISSEVVNSSSRQQHSSSDMLDSSISSAATTNKQNNNSNTNPDSSTFRQKNDPLSTITLVIPDNSTPVSTNFRGFSASSGQTDSTPLGSKGNPIRIIKQGNTYQSTEKLSNEQVHRIAQVLQRQNLPTMTANGATVVFNSEANTRIVYRAVQPHDKALITKCISQRGSNTRESRLTNYGSPIYKRGKERTRKRKRTRSESSESEDASDPPYEAESDSEGGDMSHLDCGKLSTTAKIRKKREKPRTQSGRLTNPPSQMLEDYKQIHGVDWCDYGDDDEGYSDSSNSDEEDHESQQTGGVKSKKPFPCNQCEKAYIRVQDLSKHYKETGHGVAAGRGRPKGRRKKCKDESWIPPTSVKVGDRGSRPSRTSTAQPDNDTADDDALEIKRIKP